MTEEKYQLIKKLESAGIKTEIIAKATGLAPRTVRYVKASASIEEYHDRQKYKKYYNDEVIKEIYEEMEAIKDGINQMKAQLVLGVGVKLDQEEEKVVRLIEKLERFSKGEE